jgi:hypothetical protein
MTDLEKEIFTAQQVAGLSSPRPQWIAVAVEMCVCRCIQLVLIEVDRVRIFQRLHRSKKCSGNFFDRRFPPQRTCERGGIRRLDLNAALNEKRADNLLIVVNENRAVLKKGSILANLCTADQLCAL